jgi:hypothetical protein
VTSSCTLKPMAKGASKVAPRTILFINVDFNNYKIY